jgi:hypothetical protein
MSTLTNNTSNEKSMNGLVTIDANAIFTDELDVDTLVVNLQATVPTVSALSNDTNAASTAWVTSHSSGSYVTLGTTQTITGEKTLSNANTYISGLATFSNGAQFNTVLPTSSIVAISGTQLTNKTYVDSVSGGTALLTSNNTFSGINTFNNSSNVFEATSIAINSATVLNIATNTNRTNAINIGNGTNASCNINIANQTGTVGNVNIGSGASSGNVLLLNASYIGIGLTTPSTNIINIGQANSTISMVGDIDVTQNTYTQPMASNLQLGYTNKLTGSVLMTSTFTSRQTIPLPIKGVWLVIVGFSFTANAANTIQNKSVNVSLTSTSLTEAAPGLEYYDEIDDVAGAAILRQTLTMTGVVSATAATNLFLNAATNVISGTQPTMSWTISWTRIA